MTAAAGAAAGVAAGGIGGAIFLAAVVVATWYLRVTGVPKRFKSSRFLNVMFILSTIAIAALSVTSLLSALGISVG